MATSSATSRPASKTFWTGPFSTVPTSTGRPLVEKYKKLDEIPFDFTRRMMSVLVEDPEGRAILLTKGAPEEVFHLCSHFELDGRVSPMDPNLIGGLKDEYDKPER